MPRDLPIGNGKLLILFGRDTLLRELTFPYVGEENHTKDDPFRFGVWVNGQFSWIPDGWKIKRDYLDDSLVTDIELINDSLKLRIVINDLVDFEENLYLKKLTVVNLSDEKKEVRLFLAHDFHIYGSDIGNTAEYRPEVQCLLHYKQERYFLVNIFANKKFGIDLFATGNKEIQGFEGSWRDAEDGILSKNSVAQGSVDSVLGIPLTLEPKGTESCFYWMAVGENWEEVRSLNERVTKVTPDIIFKRTLDYWKSWADKERLNYDLLPKKISRLYTRSLLIARTHINHCGSIIAGNDSDAVWYNRDTYSYMWTRDGSLIAYAFDLAGYGLTKDYYRLCAKVIEKDGYFLHKYTPSGSLASSWHPWLKDNKPQIPIQEDETALIIWALWNHYKIFKDLEEIKPLYESLIKKAADFMMNYRDLKTGLPLPSYDLWEERQGVLTFTVSTVYGGLIAAANFAKEFGEMTLAEEYIKGAARIRQAMDQYLYMEEEQRFARMINFHKDGSIEVDKTVDASLYGIFAFGAYSPDDEKVKKTMDQVVDKLWSQSTGGLIRYENDTYYRANNQGPSNPWFVTTLWLAQYYIASAKNEADLAKAMKIMEWVADHSLQSGVLAEQVNPQTNEPISVSPLTWSHGTFIATVQEYVNKLLELEKCASCGLYPNKFKNR